VCVLLLAVMPAIGAGASVPEPQDAFVSDNLIGTHPCEF